MATERKFAAKKLPLTIAFTVLLVAAFGAGCKGFFAPNALESIAIQPPNPQVAVGSSMALQAWGVYQDNSRSQIKSGVVWMSDTPAIISIDTNTGEITAPAGTLGGTAQITAAAQGLSANATATAYLANVTNLEICAGVFNTGTCPAGTFTVNQGGSAQNYYATVNSNGTPVDVTTVATWTVTPVASAGDVSCDAGDSPAVCTVDPQTSANTYTITVTYPNIPAATATIVVTNP